MTRAASRHAVSEALGFERLTGNGLCRASWAPSSLGEQGDSGGSIDRLVTLLTVLWCYLRAALAVVWPGSVLGSRPDIIDTLLGGILARSMHRIMAITSPRAFEPVQKHALPCFPVASPSMAAETGKQEMAPKDHPNRFNFLGKIGAGEEIRTLDPNLGKVVLYH